MSAAQVLEVRPLTRAGFARFGDVIETDGSRSFAINDGTAMRFNDLAQIDVSMQGGRTALSVFRGQPVRFPLQLSEVERHPLGSQAFVPVGVIPFLIVVAADGTDGRPGEPFAFLSNGRQGVNYARGVWHHPLLSLGGVSDFLVVERAGPSENCDVAALPGRYLIESVVF
ncbi:MAG: ureidoglycolate lyase [Betaproteobacteria bacterium]|nr:ureidoglycolate lyase [Betaproteobacteria bacterium]